MKGIKVYAIGLVLACGITQASASQVAVLGVDESGVEKSVIVESSKLEEGLIKMGSLINESVSLQVSEKEDEKGGFKLKKFSVGLAFEGEIGIFGWSLGTGVKQRLFYKR